MTEGMSSLFPFAPSVSQGQILDACCGGRHWWWDKAHPLAVYMDEREVPLGNEWRATWSCEPDVLGDFRAMPFDDFSFQLVVFDPPHIVRRDPATKWSTRFYGSLNPDTWQEDLRRGFTECWRVLAAGGTLVFKWSGDTSRCSPYFPAEPIIGTRWKAAEDEGTSWFIFYKPLGDVTSAEVAA
jgi:SAM-dependent methyltransferase